MRTLLFFILIVCISCGVHVSWPKNNDHLFDAFNQSTLVSYVVVNREASTNTEIVFNCVEVFRGNCETIRTKNTSLTPPDGRTYLLVVRESNGEIHEVLYPLTAVDDLTSSEMQIFKDVPCYSKELEDKYRNSSCASVYSPVCGCDNKTYGNECDAFKKGVSFMRPGKCEGP